MAISSCFRIYEYANEPHLHTEPCQALKDDDSIQHFSFLQICLKTSTIPQLLSNRSLLSDWWIYSRVKSHVYITVSIVTTDCNH